jgi:hypothetical protein
MMQSQAADEKTGTNCNDCERYKKFGDVCVMEHGKKFLWEFCKDFEAEVVLPDYKELMSTVRKDLAAERKKIILKKRRERAAIKREKKLTLKSLAIAQKAEGTAESKQPRNATTSKKTLATMPKQVLPRASKKPSVREDNPHAKMPRTASSARATA